MGTNQESFTGTLNQIPFSSLYKRLSKAGCPWPVKPSERLVSYSKACPVLFAAIRCGKAKPRGKAKPIDRTGLLAVDIPQLAYVG